MRSGRFVCHSVCLSVSCLCAASRKKLCMDLHEFFKINAGLGPFSRWFEVIRKRIDLRCHLEVTVAQQGHFGIKSTAAKKL